MSNNTDLLAILKERLARGEINETEYDQLVSKLRSGEPPPVGRTNAPAEPRRDPRPKPAAIRENKLAAVALALMVVLGAAGIAGREWTQRSARAAARAAAEAAAQSASTGNLSRGLGRALPPAPPKLKFEQLTATRWQTVEGYREMLEFATDGKFRVSGSARMNEPLRPGVSASFDVKFDVTADWQRTGDKLMLRNPQVQALRLENIRLDTSAYEAEHGTAAARELQASLIAGLNEDLTPRAHRALLARYPQLELRISRIEEKLLHLMLPDGTLEKYEPEFTFARKFKRTLT